MAAPDPSLLLFDQDDSNEGEVTTHLAPLPPISLPAFPRPSLSPTSSKLSLRGSGPSTPTSPSTSTGSHAYGANSTYAASPTGYGQGQRSFGQAAQAAGDDLNQDIARARQERLARSSGSTITSSPSGGGGAAAARANITALAAQGGARKPTDGAPPSLASFMGGGVKPPRLHRIGTGPTEQEREETERLEREMAATKSRWGKQPEPADPPARGISLASYLKGGVPPPASTVTPTSPVKPVKPASPTKPSVLDRWQPAQPAPEPVKSRSTPSMTFGTSDHTFSQPAITPPILGASTFSAPPRSRSPSPSGRSYKPISIQPGKPTPFSKSSTDRVQSASPTKTGTAASPSSPNRAFPFSAINLDKSTPPPPSGTIGPPQPRSLATLFGSTAAGPRLNSQSPQHSIDEGPAHARSKGIGGVAMPGMMVAGSVRARAESLNSGNKVAAPGISTPTAPLDFAAPALASAPLPEAPPLVEAKIISRSPPLPVAEDDDEYSPPLHQDSSPLLPDSPESLRSARPLSMIMSPQAPSSPESPRSTRMSANSSLTNSLTRLQSSNIVADRLKWGEEKEKGASSPSPSSESSPLMGGGARPTHAKKNSVLERWGRDLPNVSGTGESSPKSPKVGTSPWSPPSGAGKPVAERWNEKKDEKEEGSPKESPALVHVNRNRARPPKSTPRGATSATSTSTSSPSAPASSSPPLGEDSPEASVDNAVPSSGIPTVDITSPVPSVASPASASTEPSADTSAAQRAADSATLPSIAPSPPTLSFSSPSPPAPVSAPVESSPRPRSESVESPIAKPAVGRWSGAPIGVKELSKTSPWSHDAPSPTQPSEPTAPKHTRGVALPGMSAAKAPPAAAPAPIVALPEAPQDYNPNTDPVEEHRRRAQEEAQKAGRIGIGIGIFQRPGTTSSPDPTISKLSQAETSTKVEHNDAFPRFQDPFRATPQPASIDGASVDPRKGARSASPSKLPKHASYQGPSSSASIKSTVSSARSQSLQDTASPTSVRDAISSWGPSKSNASTMSSPTKESYGVKPRPDSRQTAAPSTPTDFQPSPTTTFSQVSTTASPEMATFHTAAPRAIQIVAASETASMMSRETSGDSAFTDAPDGLSPRARQASMVALHRPSIDRAVELAKSPVLSPRVPGDSLGLDVYSLTSGSPEVIDHNHVFYQTEILAIVNRSSLMGGREVAKMWIWVGNESREFDEKINERARKIAQAYGAVPHLVRYRFEPRELVEAFGDQITICKGNREDFNHLDTKLYSIQAHEEVVFVEEVALTSKSICSGYCTVFSLVGEVYAWLGHGSLPLEQESCVDFAETIADGRHVTVLREGSETAYFWHGLDGLEYASAHYWRFRPTHPQKVAVVSIDSQADPIVSRVESLELSTTSISLIDGGFAEHWICIPAEARYRRADISIALEAADELASQWRERGFTFKQPYHVLVFPTLIPKDLPHLARQLDFAKLNAGERPSRMNVLTPDEARHQLL